MQPSTAAAPAAGAAIRPRAADRSGAFRLRAMALACLLAPSGFLLANLSYAWATRDGGSDATGADTLVLAAEHPGILRVALTAALLGSLLVIPAALGGILLTRRRSPWLGLAGGGLMIAGYTCYFGVNTTSFTALAMASRDPHSAVFADILDTAQGDPAGVWIFLLFVAGNLLGTALLAVALLRSRAVPVWAGICVLAWPVLHVAGIIAGTEWFEVTGAALQVLGFAAAGAALWRAARPGAHTPDGKETMAM